MKTIILTVGIPGSGKSTWVKSVFDLTDTSVFRISADAVRNLLYGDEKIQGNGKRVFDVVYELFDYAIKNSNIKTILIDNTNTSFKARNSFYSRINVSDYNIFLKVFGDHDLAKERNISRDRVVPTDVLDRMVSNFEDITSEEIKMGIKKLDI